jgi:hypothetical protein
MVTKRREINEVVEGEQSLPRQDCGLGATTLRLGKQRIRAEIQLPYQPPRRRSTTGTVFSMMRKSSVTDWRRMYSRS